MSTLAIVGTVVGSWLALEIVSVGIAYLIVPDRVKAGFSVLKHAIKARFKSKTTQLEERVSALQYQIDDLHKRMDRLADKVDDQSDSSEDDRWEDCEEEEADECCGQGCHDSQDEDVPAVETKQD
jgi:predicted nuclease with TOPRIM domain